MILGNIAIALNWLSIVAFSVLFLLLVNSVLISLKLLNLSHYSAQSKRRFLWLTTLFPWCGGITAATFILLSTSQYLPTSWFFELFHWHQPEEFHVNSWDGLFLAISLVYLSFRLFPALIRLYRNSYKIRLLHTMAKFNNNLYLLESDEATAFT